MLVRKIAFLFVGLIGIGAATANAQSEARVRVVIPNVEEIEDDLKWLIELSPTPDLKKQWKNLQEGLVDAFTQGVDKKQPISVDVVFRKDDIAYELRVPIKDLLGKKTGFMPSLKGIGYNSKEIAPGYYELSEKNKKPFYLRFDKNYAWIYGLKDAVPANPPLATIDLLPLLNQKKDIVSELRNDEAGMDARRANFKELRTQLESLVKFKRNADPNAVELRKLALSQQLSEAERFLVESAQLSVSWNTNREKGLGRGEFSLSALPGTSLLKSIQEFAVKPSYFANVTLHNNPIAVGRINFPIETSRIEHLKLFYKSLRPLLESEIAKGPANDAQKAATKKAANIFVGMLEEGAEAGVLDGFIDAHALEPKKYVLVCGIRAANGKQADDIVKLVTEMEPEWQVKPDAHEHGGVIIHELTIPKRRLATFQAVFAEQTLMYVGTSQNAVWGAAGVDSLNQLKAAIDQAAQPAPEKVDPVVISYRVQVARMERLIELIQKDVPAGKAVLTKEEQQKKKDLDKYRKLAQDAMSGCESFMYGEMRRTDDKIEGYLELTECVLRYVGSMIADGAKQLQ